MQPIDPAVQSPDETTQEETTQKVRRSARRRLSVRLPSLHSALSHAEEFTTAPGAAAPMSARRLGSPTVSSPGAHYMKMTEDGEWTFSYINPEEPNQYHREGQPDKQDGFLYQLIRFPMLLIIVTVIFFELCLYSSVRYTVAVIEYLASWTGEFARLKGRLRQAETREAYEEAAQNMDAYLGKDVWKQRDETSFYDYELVTYIVRRLRRLRAKTIKDPLGIENLMTLMLDAGVCTDLGGIESGKLYSNSYTGTKVLVEQYVEEVTACLKVIVESEISLNARLKFLKTAARKYGQSALCLSGGATFGYYHIGVVKALLEDDCLPRVITGTSAGSLMASLVATRTDDELKELFQPEFADHFVMCSEPWQQLFERFWRKGHVFSLENWTSIAQDLCKNMTFREAYEKSGRILSISVVSSGDRSPPLLLNYQSTPDVLIHSAVLASSAIPGIFPPVELKKKTADGRIVSYIEAGLRWRDGSLRTDIPTAKLHQLFNVCYSVVSQVNPHIILFFFDKKGSSGKPTSSGMRGGWRGGYILSSIEHFLKLDLLKNVRLLRDLHLMPAFFSQDWSYVYLQKFDGKCTITPKVCWRDYFRILRDPDRAYYKHYVQNGEKRTWPKLSMLRNRIKIERTIFRYRQALLREKKQVSTSGQSTVLSTEKNSPLFERAGFISQMSEGEADNESARESGATSPYFDREALAREPGNHRRRFMTSLSDESANEYGADAMSDSDGTDETPFSL